MKRASDVPLMMKGTPCSRGNYAPLKTSSKTRISIEVQGLGPWRGLGQRPNLACFIGQWFGCWVCPTHNTNPAKRVRAWAQSRRKCGQLFTSARSAVGPAVDGSTGLGAPSRRRTRHPGPAAQRMLDPGSYRCSSRLQAKLSPPFSGPRNSPTAAAFCASGLGVRSRNERPNLSPNGD